MSGKNCLSINCVLLEEFGIGWLSIFDIVLVTNKRGRDTLRINYAVILELLKGRKQNRNLRSARTEEKEGLNIKDRGI